MLIKYLGYSFLLFMTPLAFAQKPVTAVVSLPPLIELVKQVGGELVLVDSVISPKDNPHIFEPKPKQIAQVTKADVFFASQVPFEKVFLKKIKSMNPAYRVVDLTQGLDLLSEQHSHVEHEGEHEHENEVDIHVWTSPVLAKKMVLEIARTLAEIDALNKSVYESNAKKYIERLDALDQELKELFKAYKSKSFLVFHPAWGYLAREYGLKQVAIEVRGREPGPKTLARLIEMAKSKKIKIVFYQKQMSSKQAEMVAKQIDGSVVEIDDLSPQYFENLKKVSHAFQKAFEEQK